MLVRFECDVAVLILLWTRAILHQLVKKQNSPQPNWWEPMYVSMPSMGGIQR
jgi:hypothetical protein